MLFAIYKDNTITRDQQMDAALKNSIGKTAEWKNEAHVVGAQYTVRQLVENLVACTPDPDLTILVIDATCCRLSVLVMWYH